MSCSRDVQAAASQPEAAADEGHCCRRSRPAPGDRNARIPPISTGTPFHWALEP